MSRILAIASSVLLLAGAASAQPADGTATATPPRDDDNGGVPTLPTHDRPLMRALAYERRDIVEELLERPGSVSAASAVELAEDIGIAKPHAEKIVAAARAGLALGTLPDLLRAGLPAGVEAGGANLSTISEADLRSRLGMTEAQAREFISYRRSARKVHTHFREVRAIREAKAAGANGAVEAGRSFMRASTAEKVKVLARSLGLTAPEAEAEVNRNERRARLLEGTSDNTRDSFARYRRADGSINWREYASTQAGSGAAGLAHFTFAMFLKELAVTLHSGDRAHLEAFVDGLMTTDFFVNYGLFSAGASAADVAYGKFVRRVTRKRFLSGVLRSNLVLAAGLAVPLVARGQFTLDTYMVDVVALGLSATAVKAAVEGVSGVYRMVRGGRGIMTLGRWGTVAGWVYSAGEAAVVLLLSDQIAVRLDRFLDERALRKRVNEAQSRLDALGRRAQVGERLRSGELETGLDDLEKAYDDLRRFRARPLEDRLGRFRETLDAAGRRALQDDTSLDALRRSLDRNPALRANVVRRFGSVEKYLEHQERERSAPIERDLREETERFDRDWAASLDEAYVGRPEEGATTTPTTTPPADGSRLALYDEETTHLLRALDGTTDPEARRLIALAIERVRLGRTVDRSVWLAGRGARSPAPATPSTANPPTTPADSNRDAGGRMDGDGIANTLNRLDGRNPAAGTDPAAPRLPAGAPPTTRRRPDDAPEVVELGEPTDELPGALVPAMGPSALPQGLPPREAATAAEPVQGTLPAQPSEPVQGTLPAQPSQPAQGTLPAQPSEPAQGSPAAEPKQGTLPAQPSEPVQGTLPAQPSEPVQGTLPAQPSQPAQGSPAAEPKQGTLPAQPSEPAQGTLPLPAAGTPPAQGTLPAAGTAPVQSTQPVQPARPRTQQAPPTGAQ